MKKVISFVLAALMLVLAVPTAFATNDYTQGTQVVYTATGSEAYTITVPALLSPGTSGTVTLSGTWADNRIITVTAEPTVTLKNSIKETDTKTLNINFAGISKAGSNIGSQTFTEVVSVADITNALFGTWSGKFNYNVDIADAPVTLGCDTLCWDGNTENKTEVLINGSVPFYKVSDDVFTAEDFPNGAIITFGGETGEFSSEFIAEAELENDGGLLYLGMFFVCYADNHDTGLGVTIPEKGLYFLNSDGMHTESLTIHGYTGFEHFDGCPHDDNGGNVGKDEETPSEVGCDTLYWDGNTEGLTGFSIGPGYTAYKISDVVPTKSDCANGVDVYHSNGDNASVGSDEIADWFTDDGGFQEGFIMIVPYDNGLGLGSEKGIYFISVTDEDGTVWGSQLTINGFTGFPHSEHCGH